MVISFIKKTLIFVLMVAGCSNMFKYSEVKIVVNQIGYLKDMEKHAWVVGAIDKKTNWDIIHAESGKIVYSGLLQNKGKFDEACAETVTCIDFSDFNETGEYYINLAGKCKSFKFIISGDIYTDAFKAAVKSYYYQRSGIDLTPVYAGKWAKPASHTNDGYLYEGFEDGDIKKGHFMESVGGWYDAGDFGKKVVPASFALYAFFKLAQYYPSFVEQTKINIPNPYPGLPDMLAEAKWELDWFFTMQEENGGVHHLIVTPEFYIEGPAYEDPYTRYVVPVTTTATADFAAIMALASRVYSSYLPEFANECLKAAKKAWLFIEKNPGIIPEGGYNDPPGINQTGKYEDTDDSDERLWASAELFAATKEGKYKNYFEGNYAKKKVENVAIWHELTKYAFFTWLETKSNNFEDEISNNILYQLTWWADKVMHIANNNGFAIALEEDDYRWGGSNEATMNIGMEMILLGKILKTDKYNELALNHINYLLGCNSLNLCFITGFGTHSVRDPHQSINTYDPDNFAPPGFIPNGANKNINGEPMLKDHVEKFDLPPAKCYFDHHWAYSCNEVCVTYNSGFVFLSGYYIANLNFEDK